MQKDRALQEQLAKLRSDCEDQKSVLNMVSTTHKAVQDDIKRTQAAIEMDNQNIKHLLGTPSQEVNNEGGQQFSQRPDPSMSNLSATVADRSPPRGEPGAADGDSKVFNTEASKLSQPDPAQSLIKQKNGRSEQ